MVAIQEAESLMGDLEQYLKLAGAFFASVGGASVVIIALAKWLGDFMSQKLLSSYNNKHSRELAEIKNKYQRELEETKSELEKARAKYFRYTEKQFESYNSLWTTLQYAKKQADALWSDPMPDKIPPFVEQLRQTKDAVNDNLLLIEQGHYDKLMELIGQFEQFKIGKQRLREMVVEPGEEFSGSITKQQVSRAITGNKELKSSYDILILEIGKSFRDHIKG